MRRTLPLLVVGLLLLGGGEVAHGRGLLIPKEKALPPLALLKHQVTIQIEDQVSQTRVEQTFRNHTDRALEATYIFPVPPGASVNRFSMWVDGKEVKGELVEAGKARAIYESIVRRTQDPGLLEYMSGSILRMRVFPIPARGDHKVAVAFQAVARKEGKLVQYVYPLKSDGRAVATLEKFTVQATVKSQHGVANVYSPTHALGLRRKSDREVEVSFDKEQGLLDRDFVLYYATGKDDVGLTALTHRPIPTDKGYFTLLISPKLSLSDRAPARDIVLVLDTSGSMRGIKIEQARRALKYCLNNLGPRDRFGLISFATTVNPYEEKLLAASPEQLKRACKWVDDLDATGGTAIHDALEAAVKMRPAADERPFTVVFFTDGEPTIGETDPQKILRSFEMKNTARTRVFTFGVGNEVNAALLDRLAEQTRALSAYVRPEEDIKVKVSGLFGKIANPVLTDLKLATTAGVRLSEVYPSALPDLFHGGQLVVMGRYDGKGATAIKLTGKLGKETRESVYELRFPEKTDDGKEFVEQLWGERKVGFLLDQIRLNGEKKELKDEVIVLARRYGITTPYTSYLIVPDAVPTRPLVKAGGEGAPGGPGKGFGGGFVAGLKRPVGEAGKGPLTRPTTSPVSPGYAPPGPVSVEYLARLKESRADLRTRVTRAEFDDATAVIKGKKGKSGKKGKGKEGSGRDGESKAYDRFKEREETLDKAREYFGKGDKDKAHTGKTGVDIALETARLRRIDRVERTAVRRVLTRDLLDVGGVWIDEGFRSTTAAVTIKAHSKAYFRLLAKQPRLRTLLTLGNHLVFVTPSGTALVIDTSVGKTKISDDEIDMLFNVRPR